MTTPDDLHLATLLSAAFGDSSGSVTPPIYQTSLYTFDTYQAFEDRLNGRTSDPLYSRIQNPTVSAFESMMAKAERGEAAVGFASGMAAISSTLLAFLKRAAAAQNGAQRPQNGVTWSLHLGAKMAAPGWNGGFVERETAMDCPPPGKVECRHPNDFKPPFHSAAPHGGNVPRSAMAAD